jgi:hypothetical protein
MISQKFKISISREDGETGRIDFPSLFSYRLIAFPAKAFLR